MVCVLQLNDLNPDQYLQAVEIRVRFLRRFMSDFMEQSVSKMRKQMELHKFAPVNPNEIIFSLSNFSCWTVVSGNSCDSHDSGQR